MANLQQVKQARKNMASALGVNFEHVEINPNDRGGVTFRIIADVKVDELALGNLREAIRKETGLGRVSNVEVSTGERGMLTNITVLASDSDDAIERVAKMRP